jgi:hypothetical protein
LNNNPVTDLSKKSISLARAIDRLPEGIFEIKINKQKQEWLVAILRGGEVVQSMRIERNDD